MIGELGHPVRRRAELGRVPWALAVLAAGVGALVLTIAAVRAADAWFVQVMLDQAASRAADEVQLGLLDRVTPADFVAPFTSEHLDDLASRLDPVLGRVRITYAHARTRHHKPRTAPHNAARTACNGPSSW